MARTAPVPNIPPIPGMCPGLAVLGGGGGSGGGSGTGTGSGGAGPGAGGEGGAAATSSDGRGANACGAGSTADCSSCGNTLSAGDPVDVASGRVYTVPCLEFALPGPLPLVVYRKYSSAFAKTDIGLGHGWLHSLAWRIEAGRRHLHLWDQNGSSTPFPKLEVGEEHRMEGPPGWRLVRRPDGLALEEDGVWRLFGQATTDGDVWLLTAIEDRNGNRISITYDEQGVIATITDSVGRVVEATKDRTGHIASFRTKNALARGAWVTFRRYEYDANANLIYVINRAGSATDHTYDEDHLLTSHRRPGRLRFHFVYDRHRRCVESWGANDDGPIHGLISDLPQTLADGVTRVKGFMHVRIDYAADDYREVADAHRVRRVDITEDGQVLAVVDGGAVATRVYDDRGYMAAHIDALGATTQWTRDANGRVIREQDALGHETIINRNYLGLPIEATDSLGKIMSAEYDARGNPISITRACGDTHRRRYDQRGQIIEHGLPTGASIHYEYDSWGNETKVVAADGGEWHYTYDLFGHCLEQTDPTGARTRFVYNDIGCIAAAHFANGGVERREYSPTGQCTRLIDADGRSLEATYLEGRLTDVTYPGGNVVRYRYDLLGRLVEIYNEKDEVRRNEYDEQGQVVAIEDFDGRHQTFAFDMRGRLTTYVDGGGAKTIYERNLLGQITKIIDADDLETTFEYDGRGRVVRSTNPTGTYLYEYDGGGNLVRETQRLDGDEVVVEHRYDMLRNQAQVMTSFGLVHTIDRNGAGRPTRSTLGTTELVDFRYDQVARELSRHLHGGGATLEFDYATLGAPERISVLKPGAPATHDTGDQPDWLGSVPANASLAKGFEYDVGSHNVMSRWDSQHGAQRFQYDAREQLVATLDANGAATQEYRYDASGNVYEGEPGRHRSYGPGNRLLERDGTTFHYDGHGRLTEKVARSDDGSAQRWEYRYDGRGLLASVSTPDRRLVEFSYDPFARRLKKRVTEGVGTASQRLVSETRFVWDKDRLAQEVRRVASAKGDPIVEIRSFVYDGHHGAPLAQREERRVGDEVDTGPWLYFVNDSIGTPEHLINARGGVEGDLQRTPYGKTTVSGASTPLRFRGQYEDDETGLHYNRYRYYDPDLGRYLNPDPAGGLPDPNVYRYCINPVSWTDPLGLAHHALAEFQPANSDTPTQINGGEIVTSSYDNEPDNYSRNYNDTNNLRPFDNFSARDDNGDLIHRTSDTEQQIMRELERRHNDPNDPLDLNEGGHLTIVGEKPPCSACHNAMQDFTSNRWPNVTIDYHWTGDPGAHRIRDRSAGSESYPQ